MTDYTKRIAREGEQEFATIIRNRSGISSGEIDFGARSIDELCDYDKMRVVDCCLLLYEKYSHEINFPGSQHLLDRILGIKIIHVEG